MRSVIEILRSQRSLAVVAGMKKTNDHAEPTKVERLKKNQKTDVTLLKCITVLMDLITRTTIEVVDLEVVVVIHQVQ